MQHFDVVVVGGGPSGAVSALRCSQLGFKTLLVEKGKSDRHKPCGGLLPAVCTEILEGLGLNITPEALSEPKILGLYVIPPSGKINGKYVNCQIMNLNRDQFDKRLREAAVTSGVQIIHESEFIKFKKNRGLKILLKTKGEKISISTRYLIGADGTYSTVKKQLYTQSKEEYLILLQEEWSDWSADSIFAQNFCMLFKGDITPSYGYIIPKDGHLLVGTGAHKGYKISLAKSIQMFTEWLSQEFFFDLSRKEKRESSAIPYSRPICGKDNIILVGDAAGFCNHISGEGIRLAIVSGIAAGEAVKQAEAGPKNLYSAYVSQVRTLTEFVYRTHELADSFLTTDEGREQFTKSEFNNTF